LTAQGLQADLRRRYLDLLKLTLTRLATEDRSLNPEALSRRHRLQQRLLLQKRELPLSPELRAQGRDWPLHAETMVGLRRLENLEDAIATVIRDDVPGDLIETGTWRGGAAIFMRAVLVAYGDETRTVWVADSLAGLPEPNPNLYPLDHGDRHHTIRELAVSLEEVRGNFARYGLLDEQVKFLPGWFQDTLPHAPIDRIALLRLDGDMYESTIVALDALYPKLSPGGFVVVDDYALERCRAAVDDFRRLHEIAEPLQQVDWTGVFWRIRLATQ
jgi:O-methyltransferase